jgi:enamine deaminase RidA (YjgF/YER057c/UK114 family)
MTARKSIYIPSFQHDNPIPNAARVGNILMSGVIAGVDPETRLLPEDLDQQLTNLFTYVKDIVEASGGMIDNIVKINVWLKDPENRDLLNKHWLAMFPDEDTRPARHTQPLRGGPNVLVTCDIVAVFH